MNRAIFYDAVQCAGLAIAGAGIWATYGFGMAAIAIGAALVVVPMIEAHLLRR